MGSAKSSFDTESVQIISGPNFTADEKDSSWKIFGGYRFDENLSVEFAYVDLGEATVVAVNGGLTDTYRAAVTGLGLSGIGSLPVGNNFSLFGRFGLILWDSDLQVCFEGIGCGSGTESGTDLAFGFGAKLDLARNLGLRAEYTMYDIDKLEAGTGDFTVLSISAVLNF